MVNGNKDDFFRRLMLASLSLASVFLLMIVPVYAYAQAGSSRIVQCSDLDCDLEDLLLSLIHI